MSPAVRDQSPSVKLPLLPASGQAAVTPLPVAAPVPCPTPIRPPHGDADGDPFSAHKILVHFDRVQALLRGETVAPVTVEVDPSNRCNHRCSWCVSEESHTGEMLSLAHFVRLVQDARAMGVRSVVIKGGGEPTLHRQIDAMLRAAAEQSLAIGLITNGSFAWRTTPQVVLETCAWVRVSLDAACRDTHHAIHGTRDYDRILRNVIFLTENRRRTMVGLNFVVEPRNYREVVDFVRLGRGLGVDYVSVRCVFDPVHPLSSEMYDALAAQAEEARALADDRFRVFLADLAPHACGTGQTFPYRRCLAPNLIGIVGGDGEVYPCCFLRGRRDFSFGNLAEGDFRSIWHGLRRRQQMERIYAGACGYVCLGGMTRSRYSLYNEILNYLALEHKRHEDFL